MFFVYYWDGAAEEFAVIGAFSKMDEANRFLVDTAVNNAKDQGPRAYGSSGCFATSLGAVIEESFAQMVDKATRARLGPLADALGPLMKAAAETVSRRDHEIAVRLACDTTGARDFLAEQGEKIANALARSADQG